MKSQKGSDQPPCVEGEPSAQPWSLLCGFILLLAAGMCDQARAAILQVGPDKPYAAPCAAIAAAACPGAARKLPLCLRVLTSAGS